MNDKDLISVLIADDDPGMRMILRKKIQAADGFFVIGEAVTGDEAMTLYDVLCWSKPHCRASGRMVNMGSLSTIQGGSMKREGDGLFGRYEAAFDQKDAALSAACAQLGGVPEGKGDVAYRIPMFPFLDVMLQYWDSDDEFPASLQLFTDDRMTDFMHYETVWFALSHMLERIKELMV